MLFRSVSQSRYGMNDKVYYLQTLNIDKNQIETKELSGIQRNFTDKCVYKITFEDDSEVILTEDHVLYDKDLNHIEAQSIKVGDEIFSRKEYKCMKVKNIEKIENFDGLVYSLNVEDNHNFFLDNGILSKNCLMVLDEAQNADLRQLMLSLTLMGIKSQLMMIRMY